MRVTAEPRSDQWNADDFIGGPRTFTITGVTIGKAEQKYDIELAEGEGRVWRPPLTMLRLLIAAWGDQAGVWEGRKVTLYRDPSVRFGADSVGGIRVSHMSDLPDGKPFQVPLTSSRGKRAMVTVEPLVEPAAPSAAEWKAKIAASDSIVELRGWWQIATPANRKLIEARVKAIEAEALGELPDGGSTDG